MGNCRFMGLAKLVSYWRWWKTRTISREESSGILEERVEEKEKWCEEARLYAERRGVWVDWRRLSGNKVANDNTKVAGKEERCVAGIVADGFDGTEILEWQL